MTALAALCVGDIGDVISIYEMIFSRAGRVETIPVDPQVQSACFQEYCSRRLYHLNRRKGEGITGPVHVIGIASRDQLDRLIGPWPNVTLPPPHTLARLRELFARRPELRPVPDD